MLCNTSLTTLNQAATALAAHGEADLAAAVLAIVNESLQQRATISTKAKARKGSKAGGAPKQTYKLVLEPGWTQALAGMRAVHAALTKAMQELDPRAVVPSQAGLASTVSKNGTWTTLVDTDNGMVSVTISKTD